MKKLALFAFICAHARLMAVPLWFEPNQGQVHSSVQFLARDLYLGDARLAIHAGDQPVVMDLIGARKHIQAEGLDPLPGITSYFLGNDPKKWRPGVPHYARVRYRDVYPGIDVIFYGNEAGQLEYDFVVAPGADASAIRLAYNQPVRVDSNGDLMIGDVRQKRPRMFQEGRELACRYVRTGDAFQLALPAYDHSQPLTVDPVLVFSTYLGGPALETGSGVKVDAQGNIYLSMSDRAPVDPTLSPFQQSSGGSYVAFAIKFSPKGKSILWYAYLGGTGDTSSTAIAVDGSGNVYLAGNTSAFDFPVKNAFQTQFGGGFNDAYFAKISSDGLSVLYASYLGGENEDAGESVAVDSSGNAYVGGYTHSHQFPVKNSLQSYGGGQDGFITEVSPTGSVVFSTYLGGSGDDYILALGMDGSAIYVTGHTTSSDFPLKGGMPSLPGETLFLSKLVPTGPQIVYSTLLGGSGSCIGFGVGADTNGNAYVSGVTDDGFLVKDAFQPNYGGHGDSFLLKIDPTGANIVFATYLGGSDLEYQSLNSLALDQAGNVFITGFTYSADFPVKYSLQPFVSGNSQYKTNVFVAEFSASGSLIYSTLFGGHGDNRGSSLTVDSNDNVYVTGFVAATDFPVLNAFQSTFGGGGDAFLFKLAPDVAPPSPFSPTPGAAQFTLFIGGSLPAPQTISIPSGGPFSITTSNAPWASASPQSGTTPETLTISVNPAGLAPKVYSGTIQIVPPSGTPFTLPVTLNVLAPAPVVTSISPSTVALNSAATTFTVTGSGFTSASVIKFQASSQLTTTFIDSDALQFSLPKDFFTASGTYSVNVSNPQAALSGPLTFTVGAPPPTFAATSVVNAASYASGSVAPGEIVTVFGSNFGTMANTSVMFDNVPATLVYVTAMQLAATVPYSVTGANSTTLVITSNGVASTPVSLNVSPSVPAIFSSDASGTGQAAALNQNNTVNGPSNPAAAGSIVALYGTGGGALTTDALPLLKLPVTATVGGVPATVYYAGIAPGLVEGAMQVNVQIPSGVTPGPAVSIAVMVGNATSNTVTLSIQ